MDAIVKHKFKGKEDKLIIKNPADRAGTLVVEFADDENKFQTMRTPAAAKQKIYLLPAEFTGKILDVYSEIVI